MSNFNTRLAYEVEQFVKKKVKYQHRGTSMFGCDCTGLIIGALKNLGYFQNYQLRPYKEDFNLHVQSDEYILLELEKVAFKVSKSLMEAGDILVFRFARQPAHIGIYLRKNIFAHCYKDEGRCCYGVIEKSPWLKRWIASYRFDLEKVLKVNG